MLACAVQPATGWSFDCVADASGWRKSAVESVQEAEELVAAIRFMVLFQDYPRPLIEKAGRLAADALGSSPEGRRTMTYRVEPDKVCLEIEDAHSSLERIVMLRNGYAVAKRYRKGGETLQLVESRLIH